MKNIFYLFLFLIGFTVSAQLQNMTYTVSPTTFEETDMITITINGSSINESTWGVTNNALYLWAWSYDINDTNGLDCPTNGTWTSSSETNRLTYNAGSDTYTMSFVPTTFYNRTNIGRIGFLVKAKDGTGDKKTQDALVEVGSFQLTLTNPTENSDTVVSSGGSVSISASNTGGNADYSLEANGTVVDTQNGVSTYSYTASNITANTTYMLSATQSGITQEKSFTVIVAATPTSQAPPMALEDGITYTADATKAYLKLNAPGKDFVYVAGSFNNYQPTATHLMKKDPTDGFYWLEITGLTSGQIETFQYWVGKNTPVTGSPKLVKTADPYSHLVLSPDDDPYIPNTSFPNIPAYPAGQSREVTVLQTGQTPYNWQVPNFVKPDKDKLVVYELLIRDFDADRNFQDVIDRISYFVDLGVNAIELMPVMEYEGNESWGYNTSFHMALDKYYGTENKLKELIDVCHQNGIAVILDLAINHAYGRNPLVRMWMNDPDGDGWAGCSTCTTGIATDNPFFNLQDKHAYGVGFDFNHTTALSKYYTKRVVKRWIEDFNIDGIRWDLTKGFTQECTPGDETCTNGYRQDRVDILKEYVDYSWSLDPSHIAIFEHLGAANEEQQWANYRLGEGKGVIMWGETWNSYKQLAQGYASNISGVGHTSKGFAGKRLIGYPESHDKDRMVYEAMEFGASGTNSPNGNLNNAVSRMSAIGSSFLLVPGPKMLWHFGELGHEISIFQCSDGSVNTDYDSTPGDCKLDTKAQPHWVNDYYNEAVRRTVFDNWKMFIQFKKELPVFNGEYAISPEGGASSLKQRTYIFDNAIPSTELKNVVVLSNFSVEDQNIIADFPYAGTWYNLMDDSSFNVTNTAMTISVPAGSFRVFGNQATNLSVEDLDQSDANIRLTVMENPVRNRMAKIDFDANNADRVEFFLFTAEGQFIKNIKAQESKGQIEIPLDGATKMYILQMITDQGNATSHILVP